MFLNRPTESLKSIAGAVLKLSDFYIQHPQASTPWEEDYCQLAYRYYYLPLNALRCQRVFQRGLQVGYFQDLTHFIDWGCGPATASLALNQIPEIKKQIHEQILFDHNSKPLQVFQDLHSGLVNPLATTQLNLNQRKNQNTSCLIFSYSMTELDEPPMGWQNFEALIVLEPSTRDDGRKLLARRKKLIEQGFSIWAPCTHQLSCPLLDQSKTDWCHDRFFVEAPEWFVELENLLPMKNRTVTTSYLLARKKPSPDRLQKLARLTGDSLDEKGKTRQLVCRSPNREFLSWMHKNIEPQTLPRGELVDFSTADFEIKSNELRLKTPLNIA